MSKADSTVRDELPSAMGVGRTLDRTQRSGGGDLDNLLRFTMPYGVWILGDGTEVLFNRDYLPIWERGAGKTGRPVIFGVGAVPSSGWVSHDADSYYFFGDANSQLGYPWSCARSRDILTKVLRDLAGKPANRTPRAQYWKAQVESWGGKR